MDLQKPTLLHGVQTQGVRANLRSNYITFFTVSYSLDQEAWTTYRGNSSSRDKVRGYMSVCGDQSKRRDGTEKFEENILIAVAFLFTVTDVRFT